MGKDKIKNKGDERGKFVSFKQEYRQLTGKDGQPYYTTAPKIVDIKGKKWPEDTKIGNGSKIDVKFKVVDYGDDKVGVYPIAIRVLKLVPYEGQEFEPVDESDEFYDEAAGDAVEAAPEPEPEVKTKSKRAKVVVDDDLEDDLPF